MTYSHTAVQIFEDNLCHIFHSKDFAIVFDPAEPEIILTALSKNLTESYYHKNSIPTLEPTKPRKLLYTFITHKHGDHSDGNKFMLNHCKVVVSNQSSFLPHSEFLQSSYTIPELDLKMQVLPTPCHTQDSVCFYIDNKYLVTGDTIFHLGVGKFFEGTAKQMCDAINLLKLKVDRNAIVLYGHDYRSNNYRFAVTKADLKSELCDRMFLSFGDECEYNPFFQCQNDEEKMGKLRKEKNEF